MILDRPLVRRNIGLNAHPAGLTAVVRQQVAAARARGPIPNGPTLALVLGCSTGYGLASRVAAAFGSGAATLGVSVERPGTPERSGTPGWYNNRAFEREAREAGLTAMTLEQDAFQEETRDRAVDALRGLGRPVDLIVYSIVSPVRVDPADGVEYRLVLKPVGKPYSGLTMDLMTGELLPCTLPPAEPDEIAAAVKVMGGEDWALWIRRLRAEGLLAPGCRTLAYSYIGPGFSRAIYRDGTIGRAKAHLEATARALDRELRDSPLQGRAWVSVNKALITRASAVLPGIALYMAALYRVMKDKGLHEGCWEQMDRLLRDRLAPGRVVPVDAEERIRLDDWELRPDVQEEVARRMEGVESADLARRVDLAGVRHDFLEAHGFDVAGVDYAAEIDPAAG
ncbi:MAG: putative reductase [candidate division TA06 bacterium ADurb.Bin417]|uniref:Enoyl-[acyl-carrier-protein] reductase [NADH] n=1 Tax=candidate division TA06 bacterium ADurb.Bin417 TaxID=1852828 RepID=A0A1V5M8S6_UNCT6|nr:MAG: putative reductase [candidate division TA06 bacterium ADurb.Bin417]